MARAERPPAPPPELLSLLIAARQAPWDDTPRLIVADWLEEHGSEPNQARAQFIRHQIRRASTLKFGKRDADYSRPERLLLKKHRATWLAGLDGLDDEASFTFFRGLVDVRISIDLLLQRSLRPILASAPAAWLDELQPRNITAAKLRTFLALPIAQWVGGLLLNSQSLHSDAIHALAEASLFSLSSLHTLDLNYNELADAGARELAAAYLPHLAHLDLWICSIGPDGARALAESATLGQPQWLNLGGNHIGEDGARALAASPLIARTRRLLLWGNQIGSSGVVALLKARQLGPLEELYLNENNLGLPAARALASWAGLPNLRALSLWGNSLRTRGAAVLAEAPLSNLRMLLLANNSIGDDAIIALANNPHLAHLEQLDLSNNRITNLGARAFLNSPYLTSLRNLNLAGNDISATTARSLGERFESHVNDEVP